MHYKHLIERLDHEIMVHQHDCLSDKAIHCIKNAAKAIYYLGKADDIVDEMRCEEKTEHKSYSTAAKM